MRSHPLFDSSVRHATTCTCSARMGAHTTTPQRHTSHPHNRAAHTAPAKLQHRFLPVRAELHHAPACRASPESAIDWHQDRRPTTKRAPAKNGGGGQHLLLPTPPPSADLRTSPAEDPVMTTPPSRGECAAARRPQHPTYRAPPPRWVSARTTAAGSTAHRRQHPLPAPLPLLRRGPRVSRGIVRQIHNRREHTPAKERRPEVRLGAGRGHGPRAE